MWKEIGSVYLRFLIVGDVRYQLLSQEYLDSTIQCVATIWVNYNPIAKVRLHFFYLFVSSLSRSSSLFVSTLQTSRHLELVMMNIIL